MQFKINVIEANRKLNANTGEVKYCCIIPAYNEERTIKEVISGAGEHVDLVIVVDDGSEDETYSCAFETDVIICVHEKNKGKGAALRTGFKKALETNTKAMLVIDADMQHDPCEIPKFLELLKNDADVDIIVGSRFLEGNIQIMPKHRRLSNFLTTYILRRFFDVSVTDSQSGFRAYRRRAIERIINFSDNRYAAETEMLIDAKKNNLRIREVPIKVIYGDEKSKMRPIQDTFRWIWVVLKKFFSNLRDKTKRSE